ncbi:MAG: hypothetical protein K2Y21_05030 [Phycisphaerales bacterium]|nr:hypothetical protein [Phycisphaerales bacterium]
MPHSSLTVLASCTIAAFVNAAPVVRSSPARSVRDVEPTLKPVEPGVGDVGPLSGSGRVMPKDLRQPANFDRVYEVEMDGKKYFVRAHGGVYAVFPRSDYVQTRHGVVPIVPAGTTFHLGGLPKAKQDSSDAENSSAPASAASPKPARPMRQDQAAPSNLAPNAESAQAQPASGTKGHAARRSSDISSEDSALTAGVAPGPAADSIWTSDFYRIRRSSALLDRALDARSRVEASDRNPASRVEGSPSERRVVESASAERPTADATTPR